MARVIGSVKTALKHEETLSEYEDVEHVFQQVNKFDKMMTLIKLVQENDDKQLLVFVSTKRTAVFVADVLSEQLKKATGYLHAGSKRRRRELARRRFASGQLDVLVATAAAACGPDFKHVDLLVNYDLPPTVEEYEQRIGRSRCVFCRGTAVSYFDDEQDQDLVPDLVKILQQADQPLPVFFRDSSIPEMSAPSPQQPEESNDDDMEIDPTCGCFSVWLPHCTEPYGFSDCEMENVTIDTYTTS